MPPQDGGLLFCRVVLTLFFHAFSPLSAERSRHFQTEAGHSGVPVQTTGSHIAAPERAISLVVQSRGR